MKHLFLIVIIVALIISFTNKSEPSLDAGFDMIEEYRGSEVSGYVVISFYVHEDDSITDVYMIYDKNDVQIAQFPEWTIGLDLG